MKISLKRVGATLGLVMLLFMALSSPLSAQSVTQGYSTDSVLQRGTVVSLGNEDTTKVVPTTRLNQDRIHGVVVAPNDASLTLSGETEKTFVATIGRFDALVSTEGGAIQAGDFLSISSLTGIAKKSSDLDPYTVGKAIEVFDGTNNPLSTATLNDSLGNTQQVAIGRILIDIGVGPNPLLRPVDTTLPEFLKEATEAIAGKEVSPVRVYIGIVIILAAAGVSGSLLYSGVKSSVISVGRNPLSKKSISKSLFQIILTSIIIFLIGLFGVYLLLRL
jgi:hypothetical protein